MARRRASDLETRQRCAIVSDCLRARCLLAMSLNLFGRLMPANEDFTKLFCEQAGHIVRAAEELRLLVRGGAAVEPRVNARRAIELAADDVARTIFTTANRTF